MPRTQLFMDKPLLPGTVTQIDIHTGGDGEKSLITKLVEDATTGVKIKTSVDKDGRPVAPGTGYVTLELALKTLNGQSLIGSGDVTLSGGGSDQAATLTSSEFSI